MFAPQLSEIKQLKPRGSRSSSSTRLERPPRPYSLTPTKACDVLETGAWEEEAAGKGELGQVA